MRPRLAFFYRNDGWKWGTGEGLPEETGLSEEAHRRFGLLARCSRIQDFSLLRCVLSLRTIISCTRGSLTTDMNFDRRTQI